MLILVNGLMLILVNGLMLILVMEFDADTG